MADTDEIETVDPRDEEAPRGRTSLPTVVLIILNLLAALVFGVILYMDFAKRQEWARAVLIRDIAVLGLPIDDKESSSNAAEVGNQPKHDLDPPLIRDAYKGRGISVTEKFMAVNQNFKAPIRLDDLDDDLLTALFRDANAGKSVKTLKEEIDRVKRDQLGELDAVAADVAAKVKGKSPDDKRALIEKILFPVCTEGRQAVLVKEKIEHTPDKDLDKCLTEAAQRRMLFDILQALEVFRPTEKVDPAKLNDPKTKDLLVNRVAELDKVTVDQLRQEFAKRCDQMLAKFDWIYTGLPRDNGEKRRAVAYLLVVLSQIEIPGAVRGEAAEPKKGADKKDADQDEKQQAKKQTERPVAFPKAQRRAEVVAGMHAFNQACEDLAVATEVLENQLVEAIRLDLGTYRYPLKDRLQDPKPFVAALVDVMKKMKISLPNENAFTTSAEEKIAALEGKIEGSEVVIAELKKVMDAQGIRIPEDPKFPELKVNQKAFEREVDALLHQNAIGFIGEHEMAIGRIHQLALLLDRRQRQFDEIKINLEQQIQLFGSREKLENEILAKLTAEREKTREMAEALRLLQQELFVAQRYLAGAHEYNLYLAERLREVERTFGKSKGGKGP